MLVLVAASTQIRLRKKLKDYKQQDIKAGRCLDNYIEKAEVLQLFKKQKFVCYYCWNTMEPDFYSESMNILVIGSN